MFFKNRKTKKSEAVATGGAVPIKLVDGRDKDFCLTFLLQLFFI